MIARPTHTARPAFTLIELLVVISIIALITGMTFPTIRATLQNTAIEMAVGQVNNSLSGARVFATQNRSFVAARRVGPTLRSSEDTGDGYSGSIVLFASDNTLRILRNDENAYDNGWLELQNPPKNGYTPVEDIEDLRIPGRAAVLGIVRVGTGNNDVRLIPPPFAIRIGRNGQLLQGQADTSPPTGWERYVFVSQNGATQNIGTGPTAVVANLYDTSKHRGNTSFDFAKFGLAGTEQQDDGRVKIPFSKVETVSGVLIVQPDRVPTQYPDPTGTIRTIEYDREKKDLHSENASAALLNWANENSAFGRILFFNRYTGQDLSR